MDWPQPAEVFGPLTRAHKFAKSIYCFKDKPVADPTSVADLMQQRLRSKYLKTTIKPTIKQQLVNAPKALQVAKELQYILTIASSVSTIRALYL